ncbi:relaxase/mobilization nuclease domain-containing protein [Campylobacter fetus subsp. venerealis]|uniref:relaxase/mobilization nuclease domain-containing protein n=1 Tax=Campylobacter fetus TaxID=196 RepID=UPI00081892C2|nr:relaxase/mobilization nuclease domain-containing protein [Campylobacter fetus]MBK3498178.1 relaxase/mobilization nuclease domain-containing protein [Campylobacter fetus subsp. venerealis]MBK3502190.1 relaxase/mobilization nuclease domain-containing protein [Campylobacter fetus subsp. venerealis]OCS16814.1 relaxase [Campylobacter fetus subsp. venerealis]
MSKINWDDFFDELKAIRAGRTKFSKSEHKYVSYGYSRTHINFSSNNKFAKQSVVKMISNLPKNSIKRCIDYTLKNSLDGYAINEKGERVGSDEVMKEWSKDFGKNENSKDAWHLMFSIKESCGDERTLKALEDSVKSVLGSNFQGHKYVMVLHTHQNNPHVHVVLNKRNSFTRKKIHFDSRDEIRDFFDSARTNFAYALSARGLNYENKNFLQKDLKKEFSKIKSDVKLEIDDYTAKDKINDYYDKMQDKNKAKYDATAERIKVMNDELDKLKKANRELLELFLLYTKKRNKKAYKLGKELKLSNKEIKDLSQRILAEIKNINKLSYEATQLNDMKFANYKDRSDKLTLLENFSYNYNKLYPKNRGASKADFENYKKVKRAIAVLRDRKDDEAKKYFNDSLITTRMLGSNKSLFKLSKKLEILDKNLYILEHSELGADKALEFKKRLNDNKEFITDVCKKRFEYVTTRLLKSEKVSKDDFLFKEYFKGVSVLGVEPNERLLQIKKEADLQAEFKADNSINKSRTQSSSIDKKRYKNERNDGRE